MKERTEEEWDKIESKLLKDKFEYPKFREEYENNQSEITITCKKHNHTFKIKFSNHISNLSLDKGCEECKQDRLLLKNEKILSKIKDLVNQELEDKEISRILNIPKFRILRLRKLGNIPSGSEILHQRRIAIIMREASLGKKMKEISKETGINYQTLVDTIRKYNIKVKEGRKSEPLNDSWKRKYTKEQFLNKLIDEGETILSLSEELGISQTTMMYFLRSIGISYNSIKSKREEIYFKEIISRLNKGQSLTNICSYLHTNVKTAKAVLKKHGIEMEKISKRKSSGEIEVENYLKRNNIDYEFQYMILGDIQGKNSNIVFIDFYISYNDKKFFIEIHGKQHFKYSPYFHHNEVDNFTKQVRRDINVREYCSNSNIILIELPWIQRKYIDIESILDKIFKEGANPEDLINIESYYEKPISEILKE